MTKKLSLKQRRFVAEYLKDQNASQACIRAGYSKKNPNVVGPRLLAHVGIREAVDNGLKKIEAESLITAEYVLNGLKEVAERCMQRQAVMIRDPRDGRKMIQKTEYVYHEDGSRTEEGVWEFDSAGANKALELLGKYKKLFTDKIEHSASDDLAERLQKAWERASHR